MSNARRWRSEENFFHPQSTSRSWHLQPILAEGAQALLPSRCPEYEGDFVRSVHSIVGWDSVATTQHGVSDLFDVRQKFQKIPGIALFGFVETGSPMMQRSVRAEAIQ